MKYYIKVNDLPEIGPIAPDNPKHAWDDFRIERKLQAMRARWLKEGIVTEFEIMRR